MNHPPVTHILAYLSGQQDAMVALLRELVLAESPSLEPETQQPVMDLLAERLAAAGLYVRRLPGRSSGGMLYARPRQRRRGAAAQAMIGHTDTVWPVGTLAEMPLTLEGNRMAGPGVYDMKAGLVQAVYALQALHHLRLEPAVTPVVLFNSDEEVGSPDSRHTIGLLARAVERVFVLEPALGLAGDLKTARKGVLRFDILVEGRAAHAGLAPEQGASAIVELAHVIQRLVALNDMPRGISVNVGQVKGGIRPNVVAPSAVARVDVRVPTLADGQRIAQAILGLQPETPGTSLSVRQEKFTPPLERTPRNRRLWELARAQGDLLGLVLQEGMAGGASDGNTTSQFTATLDGLGPIGDGAHARHEYVQIDRLVERTALLALLLLLPAVADSPGA
jgi:glutamate carboxypeptidase